MEAIVWYCEECDRETPVGQHNATRTICPQCGDIRIQRVAAVEDGVECESLQSMIADIYRAIGGDGVKTFGDSVLIDSYMEDSAAGRENAPWN